MNIRQLSAFQAVISAGGVARAADILNVTQSAVSQQIALLEQHCGFALFDRSSKRLHPTREAEALLIEVQAMFSGVQKVDRVIAAIREHRWGSISVATFPAIARGFIPQVVARYTSDDADTEFHLQSMRSRSVIDAVATRQVDLGISFLPADRDDVVSTHLQTVEAVCILPSSHRLASETHISPEHLRDENFISLGRQDKSRLLIDQLFEDRRVARRIRIETGQSDAACTLVAEGLGCSVVDPISAWSNASPRFVVRPFLPRITFNIWLMRAFSAPRSALIDNFTSFLVQQMETADYLSHRAAS